MNKSNIDGSSRNDGEDFLTMFVFPPQWTPQNPYFAITSLAGHLRSRGFKVSLRDLNVEFYDQILTPEYLEMTLRKVVMSYNYLFTQSRLRAMINDNTLENQIEAMRFLEMERFFKENQRVVEQLPRIIMDAKETLRDPRRFYNPMLLVDAFYAIDTALELVSLPYHPSRLTFNGFDQPHCLLATETLIQHAGDRNLNMFYDFMAEQVEGILRQKPGLIGISINSTTQVLPGLTLAMMLKQKAPAGTFINIGGNYFGRVKETLLKRSKFFKNFCHSVTLGEGEKQTLTLVSCLKEGGDLSTVPNLLYYDEKEDKVRFTLEDIPEKLDNLGYHDLEGLPLDLYFTPDLVLCLQSSKGCYWGKCTFCDTDFGIHHDVKSLDRMVGEIKYVRDKYGVKNFEFIDESIHPDYMKALAERLIDEKMDIHWFSNGRLEKGFTAEILDTLHKSGLTMILWGFESGNERIMKLINKGVDIQGRIAILRDSAQAGIWNFAYIFFGFPTETKEEALDTIQALCENKDIIHSYGRSVFTLGKHSLLYMDREKYGILDMVADTEELSSSYHYRSTIGMNDQEVDEMMKECTRICAGHHDYNLWYYLRYRENIHLYLVKYGLDYIKNYKVQKELSTRLQIW